jgi:two-component system response regulator RegX3
LFAYLFHNRNKVISKEELFAKIWGDEFFSDGTLNVHIRKIREKIERNPNEPRLIKTVWGIGYMLEL